MSNVEQARALFFEALDFLDASDFEAAEARLREALRLSPTNPAILTNLSVTLLQQGKRADACGFAAEAVAADPRNVEALLVLIAADLKCPLSRQVLGGRVADIAKATLTPACRRPFEAAAAFT